MKKVTLTLTALLMSASAAQASEVIGCMFSEPLVNSVYTSANRTITYYGSRTDPDETRSIQGVDLFIVGAGKFELVESSTGKVLQKLELNGEGSDGMSDLAYPYSVEDSTGIAEVHGGCSSSKLQAQLKD